MKQCITCGQFKELPKFVKRGDKTRNLCKLCYNLSKRKTPIKPTPKDGHKICASCGEEKPLSEYHTRLMAGKRRLWSYCKDCERKRDTNRYAHKCNRCGKEYRSGRKDSVICKDCRNADIAAAGSERFKVWNTVPEHNPWYGKPRCGTDNPNYNPDKTDEERELGRIIPGYKEWVQAVYKRDRYTCQCCGHKKGHNLNAHHLDGYNWCKEKRIDVSNGITLCDDCHTAFHEIYGFGDNTKEQFAEFQETRTNMLIPR